MRPILGSLLLAAALGASLSAQTLTEAAVAAAGGSVGGMAGKKVSDGVTTIFGKVDKQTAAAAGAPDQSKAKGPANSSTSALIEAGPGRPDNDPPLPSARASAAKPKAKAKTVAAATPARDTDTVVVPPSAWDDVPPPPALEHHGAAPAAPKPAAHPPSVQQQPTVAVIPPPPPPPPAVMTSEKFDAVEAGMTRAELLKFGPPSARITMFENGGLLEIFSYNTRDSVYGDKSLGEIRLTDGTVSEIVRRY